MTAQKLEEEINCIATLLMLWDGNDKLGFEAIIGLVEGIAKLVEGIPEKITQSAKWITEQQTTLSPQELLMPLNNFVIASTALLSGSTNANFPGMTQSNPESHSSRGVETGANYDPEFVSEFIERHTLMMEELEGEVAAFRFNSSPSQEEKKQFELYVKKYLHNVKGDAGSIGLSGIEKVTHSLEDLISSKGALSVIDQILYYREWVITCMNVLTGSAKEVPTSAEVINNFSTSIPETKEEVNNIVTTTKPVVPSEPSVTLKSYQLTADLDIFSEFAAEALDHLGNIEEILLNNPNALSHADNDTVFRCVHSLKGASSYFNLEEINQTSHVLENLLDQVRSGKRELDPTLKGLVFKYIDLQKELLNQAKTAASGSGQLQWSNESLGYKQEIEAYERGVSPKVVAAPIKITTPTEEKSSVASETTQVFEPIAVEIAPNPNIPVLSAPQQSQKESIGEAVSVKTFVKVDTSRLDLLIDSIGEMVIYSSMLIRKCRELLGDHESVIKTTHQVEKFSRGLQDIGMSMRLDPIKGLFQKMSRLVWDVSKKLGKEVNFVMHGEDTEVDRTVIEKLADPLMHMVRNALDHGVETPDERVKNGKPRAGTVSLSATHAGGSIHIEIKDDGRGLDAQKLTKKAIEKGLIPPGTVLTEEEAYLLIFAAGFSTAAAVTDISGRGVGMDVVRNNIESMRGTIRIDSELGKGTTFRIELPLTLAIMDGIETIVGTERFIIPTLAVLEFMKPEPHMITRTIGAGETFFFRGSYLPLFRLGELFGIPNDQSTVGLVIVIESGTEQVALMVDGMVGTCQTVIKSLGKMFDEARGFAGCAIMPNGNIGLIIDVRSLIQLARAEYNESNRYRSNLVTSETVFSQSLH